MEIREEFLKLREENLTLRTRLHEIEEIASIKSKMVFEEPYYYLQGDSEKDGPFCQRCFDADDKAIRLIYRKTTAGSYICPQCKVHYGERTKVKPISMSIGF